MTESTLDAETLRRAFNDPTASVPMPREACPPADQLDAAARRELPATACEAIVLHVASCPACTVAWKIAAESKITPTKRALPPWLGLVAAVTFLAVGSFVLRSRGVAITPAETRSAAGAILLESSIGRDAVLPRERCLLRWAGIDGARYDLTVSDERLNPVFSAQDLDSTQVLVPAERLAGVAGQRLLWHVSARLPNGERRVSSTFSLRVE